MKSHCRNLYWHVASFVFSWKTRMTSVFENLCSLISSQLTKYRHFTAWFFHIFMNNHLQLSTFHWIIIKLVNVAIGLPCIVTKILLVFKDVMSLHFKLESANILLSILLLISLHPSILWSGSSVTSHLLDFSGLDHGVSHVNQRLLHADWCYTQHIGHSVAVEDNFLQYKGANWYSGVNIEHMYIVLFVKKRNSCCSSSYYQRLYLPYRAME